jgi:hypothetical protein
VKGLDVVKTIIDEMFKTLLRDFFTEQKIPDSKVKERKMQIIGTFQLKK